MSIVNETCIFTYDYRQKEDVFVLIITHFVKGRVFSTVSGSGPGSVENLVF